MAKATSAVSSGDWVSYRNRNRYVNALVDVVFPITEDQENKGVTMPDIGCVAFMTGQHAPCEEHRRISYGHKVGQYVLKGQERPETKPGGPKPTVPWERKSDDDE